MILFTRRDALQVGAGALAGTTMLASGGLRAEIPVADVAPPKYEIEQGASLRVLRPAKFIAPDEELVLGNTKKFTEATGVQVKVDFASWEDLRPQTAVSARIGAEGCVVIDNSSAWRYDSNVPLIVPEVNAAATAGFTKMNIIANPNCSTAQLVVALKPLHDKYGVKRVVVSTYQSVSGAGKEGMDELFNQTRAVFSAGEVTSKKFPKRISFNLIPQIDVFMEDGFTKEEWKMMAETKKILDPKIKLTATCVRVPVFVGHSEAVNIEFENPISADEARNILRTAPGCLVIDKREPGGYVTPYESAGEDATYISRIREDATVENGLSFWCVSDNLRKGAALNAVQIAELLGRRHLKKG